MKLNFKQKGRTQPDPYVFEDNGKFYMYVTAYDGVEAYSADDLFGEWNFEGIVCSVDGRKDYWAPCIIKYENKFYLYFSCEAFYTESRFLHWVNTYVEIYPAFVRPD